MPTDRATESLVVDRVIHAYEQMLELHGKRLSAIRIDRLLYYLDHYNAEFGYGPEQEGEERYIDSKPFDVVNIATAVLSSQPPLIRAYHLRMTRGKVRKASDIEEWMWAVIRHNEFRLGEPVYRLVVQDALMTGGGVVFAGWDADLAGGSDEKEFEDLPIVVRPVLPEHFLYTLGGKRAYETQMEVYRRRADAIRADWGQAVFIEVVGEDSETTRVLAPDGQLIDYYDYWYLKGGKVWHTVVAGKTMLLAPTPMPNYSTLPFVEVTCFRNNSPYPHQRSLSLLYGLRQVTMQRERMVNRLLTAIRVAGDPTLIAPSGSAPDRRPGAILFYDPDGGTGPESYQWLEPPSVLRAIYEALGIFTEHGQQTSLGPPSYGAGGAPSGVAQTLALGADQIRLAVPRSDIALGFGRLFRHIAALASKYAGDKQLVALIPGRHGKVARLRGTELDGWMFDVELRADTPESRSKNLVVAGNVRQSGVTVSDRFLLEQVVGVEDPDRVVEERMLEEMIADPQVRQIALALAIEQLGGDPAQIFRTLSGAPEPAPPEGPPGQPMMPPEMGQPMPPPGPPGMPNAPGPMMPPTEAMPPQGMGQMLDQEAGPMGAGPPPEIAQALGVGPV
jgi:hypothetical protein